MTNEVEWRVEPGLADYLAAVATMEARAAAIAAGTMPELIWLVEHPPLYTAGTSARAAELLDARLPVFVSGRGGRYTYHGPGQRVVYIMLDLARRGRDIRRFVAALEQWIVDSLAVVGVAARIDPGRVGVWTGDPADPAKIAAIGVRVRRWVTLHGAAINVAPDLSRFTGIVPCGIADAGVTSLAELGVPADIALVDVALRAGLDGFLANVSGCAIALEQADQLV